MNNANTWDKNFWDKRNKAIIEEFRANDGKVNHPLPILLLQTTGAKSGQLHTTPLVYMADGEQLIVFAAKTGVPSNPDWYFNIVANPMVRVAVGSEQFEAHATIAEEPGRTNYYEKICVLAPVFADYQRQTTRIIPVIVLKRLL